MAYKNEAKSAVLNALDEYRKPNSKEGWLDVPKEKWDSFFTLYNKITKLRRISMYLPSLIQCQYPAYHSNVVIELYYAIIDSLCYW